MQGVPTHLVELLVNDKKFIFLIPQNASIHEAKLVADHLKAEIDPLVVEALKKEEEDKEEVAEEENGSEA